MVTTGLQNNQLFPGLLITLLLSFVTIIYNLTINNSDNLNNNLFLTNIITDLSQIIIVIPLFIGLWGASLFKPGNTGAGFATTTVTSYNEKQKK